MSKSRRHFLTQTSLGLLGAAVASSSGAQDHANELAQEPTQLPPGAPPAFGTGPAVGPEVSPATFAEAEKLVQINLSTADRALAVLALPFRSPRPALRPPARSIYPWQHRSRPAARQRRGHRFLPGHSALPLDRAAQAHLRAPYANLPSPYRAIRSQAPLHHHAHARSRARPSEKGR